MFTDEKFFRLEQEDRQQRVWLDSVTTKKVREKSAPPTQSHAPLSVVKLCAHFSACIFRELAAPVAYIVRCHVGTAAVRLQTGSYRAISAHARRHGLSGSLWEGNATALGAVN